MELNGTEWLCPSCKKEKSVKEREMKLKLSTRSITNKSVGRQNMYGLNLFRLFCKTIIFKIYKKKKNLCILYYFSLE